MPTTSSGMSPPSAIDSITWAQLIQVLAEEAPDALEEALATALEQGPKWQKRLRNAHGKLMGEHSQAGLQLTELWKE